MLFMLLGLCIKKLLDPQTTVLGQKCLQTQCYWLLSDPIYCINRNSEMERDFWLNINVLLSTFFQSPTEITIMEKLCINSQGQRTGEEASRRWVSGNLHSR